MAAVRSRSLCLCASVIIFHGEIDRWLRGVLIAATFRTNCHQSVNSFVGLLLFSDKNEGLVFGISSTISIVVYNSNAERYCLIIEDVGVYKPIEIFNIF